MEFREGDEILLAVFEAGVHDKKRMKVVQTGKRHGEFVYQVKPKDSGEKAEVYKDEKGNDWFEEDLLVRAPRDGAK